ncbi:MAG TPA: hypothetical protein VN457_00880 [Chlamydiales bacterium]|nr:hypothetical protein [Chlamydiales bacterium]
MSKITGAGVLPVASYNNETYYYFGREKSGLLGIFGGGLNKGEKAADGAARELGEESLKVFAKTGKAKKLIKSKNAKKVDNAAHKYRTYIVPVELKSQPMIEFLKKRKKPGLKHVQKEMSELLKVTRGDLLAAMKNKSQNVQCYSATAHKMVTVAIRPCAFHTLQLAYNQNKL